MDRLEAAVKCLEFAMAQAKAESRHCEPKRIAELHEEFYTLVTGHFLPDEDKPQPALRQPRPRKTVAKVKVSPFD